MNPFKYNWYLATRDVDSLVKSVSQINDKDISKPLSQMKSFFWDDYRYNPKNLWKTYNTPEGQIAVDVTLGLAMPALAVGRRAKKIIEITRHLSEYVD